MEEVPAVSVVTEGCGPRNHPSKAIVLVDCHRQWTVDGRNPAFVHIENIHEYPIFDGASSQLVRRTSFVSGSCCTGKS